MSRYHRILQSNGMVSPTTSKLLPSSLYLDGSSLKTKLMVNKYTYTFSRTPVLRPMEQLPTSPAVTNAHSSHLKTLTLPQLELMAASIGSRLAHFVSAALQSRYPHLSIHLWSDSEIVLHWLHSTKPLKQFISNHVTEIKRLFSVTSWHYCPTNDNPADLLTRGIYCSAFTLFLSLAAGSLRYLR